MTLWHGTFTGVQCSMPVKYIQKSCNLKLVTNLWCKGILSERTAHGSICVRMSNSFGKNFISCDFPWVWLDVLPLIQNSEYMRKPFGIFLQAEYTFESNSDIFRRHFIVVSILSIYCLKDENCSQNNFPKIMKLKLDRYSSVK